MSSELERNETGGGEDREQQTQAGEVASDSEAGGRDEAGSGGADPRWNPDNAGGGGEVY